MCTKSCLMLEPTKQQANKKGESGGEGRERERREEEKVGERMERERE